MKTLLVDFNNLTMSKLFSKDIMEKDGYSVENINYDYWKFGVFDALYKYFCKFKNIDEVVLAIDYKISWRHLYFSRYKTHRAKTKQKFNIDWDEYNQISKDFIDEIKAHFPFKVMRIKYCEGDDIIGVLSNNLKNKDIIIVSSDQDYLQLCRKGLKIYSINKQDYISHPSPEMFLKEMCLIGQPKDNIYSIAVPLDYPDDYLRKPPFGKKKAEKFLIDGLEESLNQNIDYLRKYKDENGDSQIYKSSINLKERYEFNKNLIDFNKIPNSIKKIILKNYQNYKYPHPKEIWNFFKKYKWPFYIDDFTNIENKLLQLYNSES